MKRFLLWLLGDVPHIDNWFHQVASRRCKTSCERKEAEDALRRYKRAIELNRMATLLAECQEAARRGAAISTARQAAKDGIDHETAVVILQRLYYSQQSR